MSGLMGSNHTNEYLNAKKRKAAIQLKRRDTFSQMLPQSKEALLLGRRMRKRNSAQHDLSEKPTTAIPDQATSCCYKAEPPKQTALSTGEPSKQIAFYIRDPPTSSVGSHQRCAASPQPILGKGKGICCLTTDHKIVGDHQHCSQPTLEKGKDICHLGANHEIVGNHQLCPTQSRATLNKEKDICHLATIHQTNEYLNTEKRKVTVQLKQRDTYSEIPPQSKEAVLVARCMKKIIHVKHHLSEKPTTTILRKQCHVGIRQNFQSRL